MLVTEGNLIKKTGGKVTMREVFADSRAGKRLRERSVYWTYDPVGKVFSALPVDRIGQESMSKQIYLIETETGDELRLPAAARVLVRKHGMETLANVQAMHTFRSWRNQQIARVRTKGGKSDPERYWEEMKRITAVEKPKVEAEELPVFSIKGAAGGARLLVVDGFLVG